MKNNLTALVVIDVQCGILDFPGLARPVETHRALDQTILRIRSLLDRARQANAPVIFVQHDGGPGHPLEPNTPGWPIRAEIAPLRQEPVIHKRACDAFFETNLQKELTKRGVTQLVIAGCMTPYCIDTSVRRAISLGYDVLLASDAHTTADSPTLKFEQIIAHHNAVLDGFGADKHEVRVMQSSEIIKQL
jgi:nicotinamidase-related amidase